MAREYLSDRANEKALAEADEIAATADGLYKVVTNQVTAAAEVAAETAMAEADGEFRVKAIRNEHNLEGTLDAGADATVEAAEDHQLDTPVLRDKNGVEHDIVDLTYASSDEAVATVDANGLVTGVADGSATITVTADGNTDTVAVTVPL